MSKISIVIPAYNCEAFISKCIDSILAQECDTQIIVVNDGSTDKTKEILDSYGDKICCIHKENGGVSSARNTALELIDGDFVMFCDSDDYLEPGTIKALLQKQEDTGADLVHYSYKIIKADGAVIMPDDVYTNENVVEKNEFKKEIYPLFISGIKLNSLCCAMYKAELVKDNKFRLDMKTAEDAVFNLECYTRANRIVGINKPFYCYVQHDDSLTNRGLDIISKYKCNFDFAKETLKYLQRWDMDTLYWKIKTLIRPISLTFNKLRRMKREK